MVHRLTLPVLRPGLLRLNDLKKQIVLLLLKLVVAGLQGVSVIPGCLLLLENRLVLCVGFRLPPLGFLMLLLICRVISGLLGRI